MTGALPIIILVVCSGNICRSPVAEQLLRARLADSDAAFRLTSAGTYAQPGQAMPAEAIALSRRYGGHPDGHTATTLTPELIAQSQLVLTASREHRAAVASMSPQASRYTFTLTQFARLVDMLGESGENTGDPAALIAAAVARRGFLTPLADPADDDIEDPYRRPPQVYQRVGVQIDAVVSTIARGLGGAGSAGPMTGRAAR